MSALFAQITSPENVNRAWKRMHNDEAPWQLGVDAQELHNNLLRHLLQLVEDLRTHRYCPDRLRQFPHSKANGKTRVISALTLRDKLAQRLVLNVIEPIGERLFHSDSYAYRPLRSTNMAVAKARERVRCGLCWLVHADVESFFDRIPHARLEPLIRRHIPDRQVRKLLRLWLRSHPLHNALFDGRRGIPQGATLSPFLCNLYLHAFDRALSNKGITFVRFADDFLLFATSRTQAELALEYAQAQLKLLGLGLKPSKTSIAGPGSEMQFLGERIAIPAVAATENNHT